MTSRDLRRRTELADRRRAFGGDSSWCCSCSRRCLRFAYFYLDDLSHRIPGTLVRRLLEEGTGNVGVGASAFRIAVLLERHFPLDQGRWRTAWAVHVAGYVTYSVAHTTFLALSRALLFPALGMDSYDYGVLSTRYFMESAQDFFSYATFLGVLTLFRVQQRLRDREVRSAELERDAANARLEALSLRLQPHFLFNALNTISSTVYDDPVAADEMIGRLGDLLRQSLRTADRQEITLGEELETLRAYLTFVDARFGDRRALSRRDEPRRSTPSPFPRSCCSRSSRTPCSTARRPSLAVTDILVRIAQARRPTRGDRRERRRRRCRRRRASAPGSERRATGCVCCTARRPTLETSIARRTLPRARSAFPRGRLPRTARRLRRSRRVRALIVDDEAPARAKLRRLLAAEPGVEIVGEATNGREAIAAIKRSQPDVVFLDIQMPGLDGFAVADAIESDGGPYIVFVTANDQHALRAFEVGAVDYLLKPFTPERFARVLERAQGSSRDVAGRRPRAGAGAPVPAPLLVVDNGRAVFVPVDRIDRVESERNYVTLHVGRRRASPARDDQCARGTARSGAVSSHQSVDARATRRRARDARVVARRFSRRHARRNGIDLESAVSSGRGAGVRVERLSRSSSAYPGRPARVAGCPGSLRRVPRAGRSLEAHSNQDSLLMRASVDLRSRSARRSCHRGGLRKRRARRATAPGSPTVATRRAAASRRSRRSRATT